MILRARVLVTMSGPPIPNGAVVVRGNAIEAVGRWEEMAPRATETPIDLGDSVLMPGLINAHCHLDYSMMRRAIARQPSFTKWIQRINALKRTLTDEDYLHAIAFGFRELKHWGTTTVLNLESLPELLAKMTAPPIRTWWFYEMIDLRNRVQTDALLAGALTFFDGRRDWLGGFGLNPHAPYTASAELFRLADACARATGMPLTTHLAESAEETAMFRDGTGPLFAFLESLGRDMSDCGDGSAVQKFGRAGVLGPHWIVAHLNEIAADDWAVLECARPHVVHCPRSHRYFGHRRFELRRLLDLGLNVSLGTDSLASNDSLNLFAEMRALREGEPSLSAQALLEMVTVNPARALGMRGRLGQVSEGALADLIALPFSGSCDTVLDAIVQHRDPVRWMMIDGQIAS